METEEYLRRLEERLMVGYGRWVADFNESFRDLPVGSTTFDMVIEGNMRPRGFLISRLYAWLVMPAHQAACFVCSGDPNASRLGKIREDIAQYMAKKGLSWVWLVLLHQGPFTRKALLQVEGDKTHEIGVALLDLEAREIVTNKSYVGRRMSRFIKAFK